MAVLPPYETSSTERLSSSLQLIPMAVSCCVSGETRLRRKEVTVLPHSAKVPSSKALSAQNTNDSDIQSVLPLRTAPSQMTASRCS